MNKHGIFVKAPMKSWLAITVCVLACLSSERICAQESVRPPLYQGLWLPSEFIPEPFQQDSDKPLQDNPPRSNGSQYIAINLPRPGGTGTDHWIWCFIDGITLHRTVEDAKRWMRFLGQQSSMTPASLGDEAYVPEDRIRTYLGNENSRYASVAGGFLIKENLQGETYQGDGAPNVWRRNLLVDPIRIGRITVGLRVEGNWVGQFVGGKRTVVRDTPTSEQLISVARQVLDAIRRYAKSQGWDSSDEAAPGSGTPQPHVAPVSDGSPGAGIVSADDISPGDSGETGEVPPATTALGTLIVGGISALGAGLMMLGMGVTPKDLIDGVYEIFRGAATPVVPEPPPLPPLLPPVVHRDGEANDVGEVWSDEDHGWVGRNLYDEEKARRTCIADKNEADLHSGQSEDVKEAYDRWLESKDRLRDIQAEGRRLTIEEKRLDVSMLERVSSRGVSSSETLDSFLKGVGDTTVDLVPDLVNPTVLWGTVKGSGEEVWDSLGKAWQGKFDVENYKSAGGAVLHSVKGMAEGVATIAKGGWHVVTDLPDTLERVGGVVSAIKSDPLGSIEMVTRAAEHITAPIVDASKPLSERIKGPCKLGLDIATGHALGLGLGRVINAAAELDAVKSMANKIGELKTGIFGEEAVQTGQRIWGTGQTVGAEAERAALAKIPEGHPLHKIGAINEAAAESGGKYNVRLVKGDRLLNTEDPAYQKGMEALTTDAKHQKYLTPEARNMADAVRYDQHLRAQQSAMQKMLAEHPEFKGHVEGLENTGSHAWKPGKYSEASDIDSNLRGDGSDIGAAAEKAYPEYYRTAVEKNSGDISKVNTGDPDNKFKLTADDLKSNTYGDGKAPGALTTRTGKDFVSSYKASGGGRLDVYDDSGRYTHSLDGKDPLLGGDRPFFKRGSPTEAAQSAKEFGRDVANKHFEETANLDLAGKLKSAVKNAKTIGNVTGKLTREKLPEAIAKLVKDPSAMGKQETLGVLEDFLRKQ